jgi:hypothetical protein
MKTNATITETEQEAAPIEVPKPTAAGVRAAHTRCLEAVRVAEAEAEKAGAAVSEAQALVAKLTAQIAAHDGGDGFKALSAERTEARDRVENLTPRLSARMDTLSAARAALMVAEKALDEVCCAEATATLRAAGVELDSIIEGAAASIAAGIVAFEEARRPAADLSSRVQLRRGVPPESLCPVEAAPPIDAIGRRITILLHEAVYGRGVTS